MTAAGETGVILTRNFSASPEALFRAHVEPDLIQRWMLGPEGWTMTECRTDPRAGGGFHFAYDDNDGHAFVIKGTYHEIERPHRLKHRETMEMPDGETRTDVETRFEPNGDGTRLKVALGYASTEIRDAILTAPMRDGMEASYARLDELLS